MVGLEPTTDGYEKVGSLPRNQKACPLSFVSCLNRLDARDYARDSANELNGANGAGGDLVELAVVAGEHDPVFAACKGNAEQVGNQGARVC